MTITDVSFRVTVYGTPAPQGSKRHVGGGRLVESSKYVAPWREAVKAASILELPDEWVPLDGELHLWVMFYLKRPASHFRTGKNAHLLKDGVPQRPTGAPDLSKLVRSTEDALTDAGVIHDDARITDLDAGKRYAGDGRHYAGPSALATPGAILAIGYAPALN